MKKLFRLCTLFVVISGSAFTYNLTFAGIIDQGSKSRVSVNLSDDMSFVRIEEFSNAKSTSIELECHRVLGFFPGVFPWNQAGRDFCYWCEDSHNIYKYSVGIYSKPDDANLHVAFYNKPEDPTKNDPELAADLLPKPNVRKSSKVKITRDRPSKRKKF